MALRYANGGVRLLVDDKKTVPDLSNGPAWDGSLCMGRRSIYPVTGCGFTSWHLHVLNCIQAISLRDARLRPSTAAGGGLPELRLCGLQHDQVSCHREPGLERCG